MPDTPRSGWWLGGPGAGRAVADAGQDAAPTGDGTAIVGVGVDEDVGESAGASADSCSSFFSPFLLRCNVNFLVFHLKSAISPIIAIKCQVF